MSSKGTVVVLTDGEPVLAKFMDQLRQDSWRVLATARAYDIVFWLNRLPVRALIARTEILRESGGEFLRRLHDFHPRPLIVLLQQEGARPEIPTSLFDVSLAEPFSTTDLASILEYGAIDKLRLSQNGTEAPETEERSESVVASTPSLPVAIPRVFQIVSACRVLAELERDRNQLLTTALDFFMRMTESRRGSIMLKNADETSMRLVKSVGFPESAPRECEVRIGDQIAGAVLADEKPLLVSDVRREMPTRPYRGYRGTSFMVVPLSNLHTTLGVVNLTDRVGGEEYSKDDLMYALMLADQTAVTLSNAALMDDLHAMTVIDPLTHLHNRRFFDSELRREFDRAKRYNRQLTLALLDIDNFKLFNDVNGYVTGDRVLKFVGRILAESFRSVDIVTRWGGDEFGVLLPETGRSHAHSPIHPRACIERVRRSIEEADLRQHIPELSGRITLSVGVATYPDDCRSDSELFTNANLALHRAKKSGTNRTCYYGETGDAMEM